MRLTLFRSIFLWVFLLFSSADAYKLTEDKKVGVDVNPFYLFIVLPSDDGEKIASGTISYFDHINYAEMAFPIHYISLRWSDYKQYTVDFHYRKYANDHIGGFYISGFARLAHLSGKSNSVHIDDFNYIKQTKLGLGVGVGVKVFLKNGIYWGAGVSVGRYLTSKNEIFSKDSFFITDDIPFILDVELFKFGYAF